jgi:hypothetical protein
MTYIVNSLAQSTGINVRIFISLKHVAAVNQAPVSSELYAMYRLSGLHTYCSVVRLIGHDRVGATFAGYGKKTYPTAPTYQRIQVG